VKVDAFLYLDSDMRTPDSFSVPGGRVAAYSRRGPDKPVNQDAAAVIPVGDSAVALVVADGVGGRPAGERAARIAVESLVETLTAVSPDGPLRVAVLDGFERATERILELKVGAGTTLAVVSIHDGGARSYHVGDSEVLVFGQRGRMKHRTVSHAPVAYGVEAGLIHVRDALDHEDRHLLDNAVGSPDMRIEIGPVVPLRPRDTVVVGSDGLFDNLRSEQVVEKLRAGPLDGRTAALAEDCYGRMLPGPEGLPPGKPDDLCFIVYRPASR
jgi:serine/threonine protein phosphatase PrpC